MFRIKPMFKTSSIKAVGVLSLCLASISLTPVCHAQGSNYGGGGQGGGGAGGSTGGTRATTIHMVSPFMGSAANGYYLIVTAYTKQVGQYPYFMTVTGYEFGPSAWCHFDYYGSPYQQVNVLCTANVQYDGAQVGQEARYPALPSNFAGITLGATGVWNKDLYPSSESFASVGSHRYLASGQFYEQGSTYIVADGTTEWYGYGPNPAPPTDHNNRKVTVLPPPPSN
jgi:hypothetical protein